MLDPFDREITYLRVSVTDRCDLRCTYCMPEGGVPHKDHKAILSYEQIEAFSKEAVLLGITKIRLTGGEPLIRRDVETLVGKLSSLDGLRELTMTTNGTRLAEMAAKLKANGLDRVNVSLDTLDADEYRRITRGGELKHVLKGIDAALGTGLVPVKINMVILADTTPAQAEAMRRFCDEKGLALQTIMHFSLYDRRDLSERFRTDRPPRCRECNRLRLTADGFLKPCLFSEDEIKVDFNDIRGSILRAVAGKPKNGSSCRSRSMCQIGG